MTKKDPKGYYAILELRFDASKAQVKSAYRRRAKQLHPDRNNAADATKLFQLLHEAYGVLIDESLRAEYDVADEIEIVEENSYDVSVEDDFLEPVVCCCCMVISEQPRYAIFYEVKSFFITKRKIIEGIFCSVCAEEKATKALMKTWLFGWWGLPYGPLYSLEAIFINLLGGKKPSYANANLLAQQAYFFAASGREDLARAVSFEALRFVEKADAIKSSDNLTANNSSQLKNEIEIFLESLGGGDKIIRLKNSWIALQRPLRFQLFVALVIGIFLWNSLPTGEIKFSFSKILPLNLGR